MFELLFSFRGRITRLEYLGWSVLAFAMVVATALMFLLFGAALAAMGFGGSGPAILGVTMAATMTVVAVWSSLALGVRRIRDTGYDPAVVMGIAITATLMMTPG